MPMEELLAMYGYGNAGQQPLLPPSEPAPSNSASVSVVSSSSSSSISDADETASATAGGDDGQMRNGGNIGGSLIRGITGDTAMHTSRLLRCEHC